MKTRLLNSPTKFLIRFILALFKQILPSDDFCWTMLIFNNTGTGGIPCSCLFINLPVYNIDNLHVSDTFAWPCCINLLWDIPRTYYNKMCIFEILLLKKIFDMTWVMHSCLYNFRKRLYTFCLCKGIQTSTSKFLSYIKLILDTPLVKPSFVIIYFNVHIAWIVYLWN